MISKETLPSHWDFLPIRAIFYESDKRNGNDTYELLSVTQNKGIIKQSVDSKKDTSNDDKSKYKVVLKGSIAYNKMRMWQGAVGINELEDGIVSPAYVVINPKSKDIDTKYYYYLFKSTYMISQFGKSSYGLVDDMNSLRYEHFRNIYVPIPPLEEQRIIVQKIHKKVQDINSFIEKKKKFIELLKEQKEAIINQAVTKGIDNSVKLKDSGIEWLGKIPKHWKVKKLKYILKEKNTRSESGTEALLALSKYYGIIQKDSLEERAGQAESLVGYKNVYINDLVVNRMQAVNGLIGVAKIEGITSPDYAIYTLKNNTYIIDYFGFLLKRPFYLAQYKQVVTGVMDGYIRLYTDDLFHVKVPIPPQNEQQKIVSCIETELSKIDTIIERTQKEIELIQEYKISFISEVVIGNDYVK